MIPKKIAILIWRVKLGRIPCREVLDKMGIDLNSLLCPICLKEVETASHALVQCEEASKIWQAVARWWKIDLGGIGSVEELLTNCSGPEESDNQPKLWKETVWSFIYLLWSHRNRVIFDKDQRKVGNLFLDFQRKTFEWIARRLHKKKLEWNNWLSEPRSALR